MRNMQENNIKLQKAWMLVCLIEKYYETDAAGGCCHIITDDGNYTDSDVNFCIQYSKEHNDYWGELIATLFLEFTEQEREQIVERSYEIEQQIFN